MNYGGGGAYAPQEQMGRIELNLAFNPMQLFLHGITPRVLVNGHFLNAHLGRQGFDMPPGGHWVECSFPYLLSDKCCLARMQVPVYPGHVTVVTYQTPTFMFSAGTMRIVQTVPMNPYQGR